MKKFDGILLCTDLDGTLLRSDKTISKETHDAIEYFKSEGGLFTFITGRMPYTSYQVWEMVKPNAPFGCINGGGIYDYEKKEYVYTNGLDREALELVKYISECIPKTGYQINTFDKIYFCKESYAMARFRRLTGYPNYEAKLDQMYDKPLAKVVFGEDDEELLLRGMELLRAHPLAEKYDFIRSERVLYEILPKGNSKGKLLTILARHLGIDPNRCIGVGDYDNDVSLLEAAKVGIAVANATDKVKAVADYITVTNDEDAIARIIYDIENGNIKI